jgi:hypothetical protein
MKVQNLAAALTELQTLADSRGRANKALGSFNSWSLCVGYEFARQANSIRLPSGSRTTKSQSPQGAS